MDAVTLNGETIQATVEGSDADGGARPVIRLPGQVVLTRIDPARRETSMLVRIRPGWQARALPPLARSAPASVASPVPAITPLQ